MFSMLAWFSFGLSSVLLGNTTPGAVGVEWDRNPETDVTGYKVYWGQASRIYDQVQDAGDNPQALLTDLAPGQPYYCAVTAYNGAGQESAFSAEILVVYGTAPGNQENSGRLVLLEAENGQLGAPMTVFHGGSESWVDSSFYSQLGWTELNFQTPVSGDYHVWCRVKAPADNKDSFFVSADGGVEEVFHVYGTSTPPAGTRTTEWIWRRIHVADAGPRTFALEEGSHTLRFRVREPGTLLDRVVLSSDSAFVPSDSLPRSGDALVVTGISGSQSVQPGGSVTLAVASASTGPVTYQWFKGGVAIPDANSAALLLDGLDLEDSGDYSVTLASGSASANAGPVALTVGGSVPSVFFQVTRFTVNPDRTVSFEVDGGLSSNVQVFASSDLVQWESIGTKVNTSGVIDIADPAAAAGANRRFYRLVSDAIE